ncbi:MAG: hypothetical protein ABI884_00050 [Gemmatimonadota bacterium]
MRLAPDITIRQREELEVAGLTLRAIEDAVAHLRVNQPNGFTTRDVSDTAHLQRSERSWWVTRS